MLLPKVQKILVDNKWQGIKPGTMTQLAARVGISYQHLRRLIELARPQDIDRIAQGLGIEPEQLN